MAPSARTSLLLNSECGRSIFWRVPHETGKRIDFLPVTTGLDLPCGLQSKAVSLVLIELPGSVHALHCEFYRHDRAHQCPKLVRRNPGWRPRWLGSKLILKPRRQRVEVAAQRLVGAEAEHAPDMHGHIVPRWDLIHPVGSIPVRRDVAVRSADREYGCPLPCTKTFRYRVRSNEMGMNCPTVVCQHEWDVADERARAVDGQHAESPLRRQRQVAIARDSPKSGVAVHRVRIPLPNHIARTSVSS